MKFDNPFIEEKKSILKELDRLKSEHRVIDKRKAEADELQEKISEMRLKLREINKKSREFVKEKIEEMKKLN